MGIKHSCDAASRHVRCRHTSAKDLEKSPGSRFLFIFLPGIHNGSGSFCSDLYDTVAKKLSRKPACTENYDSDWLTRRSIAEARLRCMNSVTLPKQCFVSDDQLKSHKSEQESKVIQEKQDRVNSSRSKWNESCQQVCRKKGRESSRKEYEKIKDTEPFADNDDSKKVQTAQKRQESTKLRRRTKKLMAKEYAEVYMSEQHESIDACGKERNHTSNEEGTDNVCNEYRDLTKDKNGENDSSCTTLLDIGCCSKADEKHKLNVSHGVHGAGFERKGDAVLLAENDTFEENMKTHTKLSNSVSGVERKEQVKKVSKKMKKKLDRPTSYTSSQAMAKSYLRLLALSGMISLGNTTSLATRTNDESIQRISSYDLLSTDVCSRTNFDRSQSCQLSGYQLKDTIRHCGFQELCEKGDKARCVNTLQGGMAHICSPENLTCPAGIWRKAWIDTDNPDVVRVKEEKCPYGTFQPYESNCFDACKATHLDTSALPEKYIVFSEGDASSPTYVYCNYKKGYFNLEYKTFLNYDEGSEHNPYFCWHVDKVNRNCTEKKYPLPNGTCVSDCLPGECRDDHDEFICKRNCSYKASDKDDDGNISQQNEDVDECHENDDICKNGVCQNTHGSYICECSEGFMMDQKSGECIDVDECHENDDICKNGVCQNTHGSYICECSEGFMMDQKSGECIERGNTQDKSSDMKVMAIILLSTILPTFLIIGTVVIVILLKSRRGTTIPADDDTTPTSSDAITQSTSSVSTTSEEQKTLHGKRPFNKVQKTNRKTFQRIEFQNDVNSVQIYYNNHGAEGVDQNNWKQTCKVDDERIDLLTEEEQATNNETEYGMPKTRFEEVKESDPACHVDETPLLHREIGLDRAESKSPNDQKFFGTCAVKTDDDVLHKKERKGFEGEGLKKNVDDTFTLSLMTSLKNSMESCGALIYKGDVAGTVFRVGSKYVMTAFHVIRSIIINPCGLTDYDITLLDQCHDVFVNFMESVCDPPGQRFGVKVAYYKEDIDVAILELVGIMTNAPPSLLLWPYDAAMLSHKSISIAGYGHEKHPYKKHLEKCQVLTKEQVEDRFKAAHAWLEDKRQEFIKDIRRIGNDHLSVDRGYAGYDNENVIKFDCFMGKGLSGGPVLTNEANSVKVIGIVIGGRPELYFNLSPQKQVSFPNEYRFEFGVKMSLIYNTIRLEKPDLASDIFPIET